MRIHRTVCSVNGTQAAAGPDWLHEVDGYRLMPWREGDWVLLYTRGGFDWHLTI